MKKLALAISLLATTSLSFASVDLSSEQAKLSYAIGTDLGKNFKQQDIQVDPEAFMAGMKDALEGKQGQMTTEEMTQTLQAFQKKMLMKRMEQYQKQAQENKKQGEAFLAANKNKKGVVTTDSGLQYKVLEKGKGTSPTKSDTVVVEYTGRLINGKVFDSSERNGKPAKFNVSQVIKGWTEALQMMQPGAKWELYVPSDLAYGPRGVGGPIGPNETLIFEIKLLSVEKGNEKNVASEANAE